MSFSERMELVPEKQIQTDEVDSALRHRIINMVEDEFHDRQAKYVLDALGCRTIREDGFSAFLSNGCQNLGELIKLLETLPWYKLYDVMEYGYAFLKAECADCGADCNAGYDERGGEGSPCERRSGMEEYAGKFNTVLEQEKSAYRLIAGCVSPIIGKLETDCLEEAAATRFPSVNRHLQKALQLYSDRKNPDYENSVKESISAVEAMCCIITGMTGAQATLGNALKQLEGSGVILHGALKAAFEKLYGYASDADGIRHGGINFANAPAEDAKYMLVSCSAFINYLLEKYGKIGGAGGENP